MKAFATVLAVIGILMTVATAFGAGTTTVAVSTNVLGKCAFLTAGTVSFTLDPSAGGTVNGAVTQPTFWCTKGQSYTITDDNGINKTGTTHRMRRGTTTEYIRYTFNYTGTGTGTGRSTAISMNITASVAEAAYINATSGTYSDTVTLTINP